MVSVKKSPKELITQSHCWVCGSECIDESGKETTHCQLCGEKVVKSPDNIALPCCDSDKDCWCS